MLHYGGGGAAFLAERRHKAVGNRFHILGKFLHCVHTAHAEAEMGRVRFPKLQSNLWCDLLTVQWPK